MNMILIGDAVEQLRSLENESVQCCVTSPPYYGLRDYGVDGQIGHEERPEQYVDRLLIVFREVMRVLKKDGTLWLNLGDTYAANISGNGKSNRRDKAEVYVKSRRIPRGSGRYGGGLASATGEVKPKDLFGIPWRVAFALQEYGWYLRQDIIWAKPNPMPESVRDRCTKSHEYVFLMSKNEKYFYDWEAIAQQPSDSYANDSRWKTGSTMVNDKQGYEKALAQNPKAPHRIYSKLKGAGKVNRRSVWTIATEPYKESHFATMPTQLVKLCVLAGSREGDVVLDPFAGSGTTGQVAKELGRKFILIELNSEYKKMIERRTQQECLSEEK